LCPYHLRKISLTILALDSLDKLKKGTEDTNIHARESIRFFDRMQTPSGRKQITGVKIQGPTEKYANWSECLTAAATVAAARSPTGSPVLSEEPEQDPPSRIKELLNCAIYCLSNLQSKGEGQVLLVTNDEIVREWAELYKIPTVGSADIGRLVQRENVEFAEKKRHYDYASANPRSPSSPMRGGRGGGRGGRGGGGVVGGRRGSWKEEERGRDDMNSNGFGRGRYRRDYSPPDYVLRGPPRGVARGRGKLWEP